MAEKRKYKYDIISERILDDIKSGKWKIGEKLPPEAKLVEEYGVSRVTLREGLKKLSMLGLLRIEQGDGTYVNEILPSKFMQPLLPMMAYNRENIDEIYDARICVESWACQLAAERRTAEDLREIEELLIRMDQAIAVDDFGSYSECDYSFHVLIVRIGRNKILEMINRMLDDIIAGYVTKINQDAMVVKKSVSDHWQIFWALQDKNGVFARQIMAEHLERARRVLIGSLHKSE